MSQPHRYTVLYYKRTNKVHKHRGTSRQDGILSIAPPPLCSVSLLDNDVANANDAIDDNSDDDSDDGNKYYGKRSKKNTKKQRTTKKQKKNAPKKPKSGAVIYSGVNSELAKRAADITEDDEIVLSGQWECLIISKLDGHDDSNNSGNDKSEANKKLLGAAHNKIGTQKSRGIMNNHGKASSLLASSKSKNPLLMKQRGALMSKPGGLTSRSTGGATVGASVGNSNSSIRAPLHSVKSNNEEGMINQSSKLTVGAAGFKPSAQGAMTSNAAASLSSAAATAMASGKMKKDKNGEWYLDKSSEHDNDDGNAASASTITKLRKTNIPSSLVRGAGASSTLGAGLMRKRPLGSIGGGIISGGGLLKRSSIPQPRSTMSGSSLKPAAAAAIAVPNNNNFFPGAQGDKINIPNSIREILRPHQREGIAFLWNCVTGVSVGLNNAIVRARQDSVASCSSSLSSMGSFDLEEEGDGMDSDVEYDDCGVASLQGGGGGGKKKKRGDNDTMPKGAVLADEMGLGKTLMTIATIFALHRRQRDRRFIVVCPSSLVSNWAKEFD
eukprot:scaffold6749_cov89-Skeletonema_marinoi.AAC.1